MRSCGLIDPYKAFDWDCNGNGIIDADDVGNGTSLDLPARWHAARRINET